MGKLFKMFLSILLVWSFLHCNSQLCPALYIFGDSTVDGGNNPPKFLPYGIDLLPTYLPTRWTNGQTFADFIATMLGLPLVPPSNNSMLAGNSTSGINFAFGGSGILPETYPDTTWCFDKQINNFRSSLLVLGKTFSTPSELQCHLNRSLFLVSFGINDFSASYFVNGIYRDLEPDMFADFLLSALKERLTTLYALGGRKFVVNNIWPMGCMPYFTKGTTDCGEFVNNTVRSFADSLPSMLQDLASSLTGFKFSYSDNFALVQYLDLHTLDTGITNTTGECYHGKPYSLCQNRDDYIYFDSIHTTQALNSLFAEHCFHGTLCFPYNIYELATS